MFNIHFARFRGTCSLVSSNKNRYFHENFPICPGNAVFFKQSPFLSLTLSVSLLLQISILDQKLTSFTRKNPIRFFVHRTRIVRVIHITRSFFKRIFGHFSFTRPPQSAYRHSPRISGIPSASEQRT